MVESALNVAAEQVVEWSAYGRLIRRDGQPLAARRAAGPLSLRRRAARHGKLAGALGRRRRAVARAPRGAREPRRGRWMPRSTPATGRRAAHDAIDARLREWTRTRERDELVVRPARARHSGLRGRGSLPAAADEPPAAGAAVLREPRASRRRRHAAAVLAVPLRERRSLAADARADDRSGQRTGAVADCSVSRRRRCVRSKPRA